VLGEPNLIVFGQQVLAGDWLLVQAKRGVLPAVREILEHLLAPALAGLDLGFLAEWTAFPLHRDEIAAAIGKTAPAVLGVASPEFHPYPSLA